METSRTMDSQASRLSRYTQRIQHIMGRSKTKSKSPFRPNHTKLNKQDPKQPPPHPHVHYNQSISILTKIINLKSNQLMSNFFLSYKLTTITESNPSKSQEMREELPSGLKPKPNILLFRLQNIFKKAMHQYFLALKLFDTPKTNGKAEAKIDKGREVKIKNQLVNVMVRGINHILKQRYRSTLSKLLRFVEQKQISVIRFNNTLMKLFLNRKQYVHRVLSQNVAEGRIAEARVKFLISKYVFWMKSRVVQILQVSSIESKRRARDSQLLEITSHASISMFMTTLTSIFNTSIMKAFSIINQCEDFDQGNRLRILNQSYLEQMNASPRQRRFPRSCYRFKRLLEIFHTNQMVLLDEAFHALYQNKNSLDYLYQGCSTLKRIMTKAGFQMIKMESTRSKQSKKNQESVRKLVRLLKVKIKLCTVSGFWGIWSSSSIQTLSNAPDEPHKCSHRLFFVLNKLRKKRLVESYIELKCADISESGTEYKSSDDREISSIIIYDDVTSFLEQREEAFNSLKNGYEKLKNLVGVKCSSPLSSPSPQSIRAINQIKARLTYKLRE